MRFFFLFLSLTVCGFLFGEEKPFDRGIRLFKEGKYKEAIDSFKESLKEGDDATIHYNIASAYYRLGDYDSASEEYKKALQLKPEYEAAQLGLACSLASLGKTQEALTALSSLSFIKQMKETFLPLIAVAERRGDEAAQEALLSILCALSPADVSIKLRLSEIRLRMGDSEGALSVLHSVLRLVPENPSAHLLCSVALRRLNRLKEAADEAEIALALGEKKALRILAQLYIEMKLPRISADYILSLAQESNEKKIELLTEAAQLYLNASAFEEALKVIVQIPKEMQTADTLLLKATALNLMKNFDEALSSIEETIKMADTLNARLVRAQILFNAGRLQEAEKDYKEILEKEPYNAAAIRNLSAIFERTGRHKDAEKLLKTLSSELKR